MIVGPQGGQKGRQVRHLHPAVDHHVPTELTRMKARGQAAAGEESSRPMSPGNLPEAQTSEPESTAHFGSMRSAFSDLVDEVTDGHRYCAKTNLPADQSGRPSRRKIGPGGKPLSGRREGDSDFLAGVADVLGDEVGRQVLRSFGEQGGALATPARGDCEMGARVPELVSLALFGVCLLYTSDAADE